MSRLTMTFRRLTALACVFSLLAPAVLEAADAASKLPAEVPAVEDTAGPESTVVFLKGKARYSSVEGEGGKLALGQRLPDGSQVVTDEDSAVKLRMHDGNEIILGPNSEMTIDSIREEDGGWLNQIGFLKGMVRGLVEKLGPKDRLEVVTSNAVAAVKGTDFVMELGATTPAEEEAAALDSLADDLDAAQSEAEAAAEEAAAEEADAEAEAARAEGLLAEAEAEALAELDREDVEAEELAQLAEDAERQATQVEMQAEAEVVAATEAADRAAQGEVLAAAQLKALEAGDEEALERSLEAEEVLLDQVSAAQDAAIKQAEAEEADAAANEDAQPDDDDKQGNADEGTDGLRPSAALRLRSLPLGLKVLLAAGTLDAAAVRRKKSTTTTKATTKVAAKAKQTQAKKLQAAAKKKTAAATKVRAQQQKKAAAQAKTFKASLKKMSPTQQKRAIATRKAALKKKAAAAKVLAQRKATAKTAAQKKKLLAAENRKINTAKAVLASKIKNLPLAQQKAVLQKNLKAWRAQAKLVVAKKLAAQQAASARTAQLRQAAAIKKATALRARTKAQAAAQRRSAGTLKAAVLSTKGKGLLLSSKDGKGAVLIGAGGKAKLSKNGKVTTGTISAAQLARIAKLSNGAGPVFKSVPAGKVKVSKAAAQAAAKAVAGTVRILQRNQQRELAAAAIKYGAKSNAVAQLKKAQAQQLKAAVAYAKLVALVGGASGKVTPQMSAALNKAQLTLTKTTLAATQVSNRVLRPNAPRNAAVSSTITTLRSFSSALVKAAQKAVIQVKQTLARQAQQQALLVKNDLYTRASYVDRNNVRVQLSQVVLRPDAATVQKVQFTQRNDGPQAGQSVFSHSQTYNKALPEDWTVVANRPLNDAANLVGGTPSFYRLSEQVAMRSPSACLLCVTQQYDLPQLLAGTWKQGVTERFGVQGADLGYVHYDANGAVLAGSDSITVNVVQDPVGKSWTLSYYNNTLSQAMFTAKVWLVDGKGGLTDPLSFAGGTPTSLRSFNLGFDGKFFELSITAPGFNGGEIDVLVPSAAFLEAF